MTRSSTAPLVVAAALLCGAPALDAQQGPFDRYLDHRELTAAVQGLASRHGELVSVEELARSDAGREIWLLTVADRRAGDPAERPALLVVANLEGNHLIGSSAALFTAEHLATQHGVDPEVTRLLEEHTVYVLPRMNPDGAELVRAMPAYELPYKPHPSAPDRGGLNAREIGADLNGDGLVTLMRVPDPEGRYMPDPDESRLLREADRARAERGLYRILVEGIDPDEADAYLAHGTDGVNLNRNFPHEYLYFQPHVGPNQVSEVETRALADFMFERTNIAAVLTFSPYDNLRSPTPTNRQVPEGVAPGPPSVPTNVLAPDRPFHEYISEQFGEITGLDGDGAGGEAGSFPQYVYFQVGLPSFTTPVYAPAAPEGGRSAGPDGRDAHWLAHLDAEGIDGFVEWTEAEHPTLGTVEVGGFRPNVRVNPPPERIVELAEAHARFAVWLGGRLPRVEIAETAVEARGDNVFLVTATLANERYLPTRLEMGLRVRTNRPITVRLTPADGVRVLSGNVQQQTTRLEGMGGRETFRWLVQAAPGTQMTLEVHAERAGGLQSRTITLR